MSDLAAAIWGNILSWFFSLFKQSHLLITTYPEEEKGIKNSSTNDDRNRSDSDNTKCILISQPGGIEQLRMITLKKGICTLGFNLPECAPAPFVTIDDNNATGIENDKSKDAVQLPKDCVIIRNKYFSVNYADCCIRWGLYESANKFVGWPIVPGFDVCGEVEHVGSSIHDLKVGDIVFGCTLFGAYSSRIVIPRLQLRVVPKNLTLAQASSLPAVSLTALYALFLAGHWPKMNNALNNKSILIHSAAGGVGSMLVQMSKILGLSPIVGVVGNSSKVSTAKRLGCDIVIDKSNNNWKEVACKASPTGYGCIMDANGISTLQQSYNLLAPTGRLIVFGFHTNLPINKSMLSPMSWFSMGYKMLSMPKYDPMELCTDNKSILGFNLSFLSTERNFCTKLMDQIYDWLVSGELICSDVTEYNMKDIAMAHSFIQSGKSIGKIVIKID